MTFNTDNQPWVHRQIAAQDSVSYESAIQQFQDLMHKNHSNLPILPVPLIVEQGIYNEICSASKLLIEAQAKIINVLMSHYSRDELLQMFNLPDSIKPLIDWDELKNTNQIIGRFDIVPSIEGYQFCEFNADSSSGGLKLFDCMQAYGKFVEIPNIDAYASPRKNIANYLNKMVLENKYEQLIIFTVKKYIHDGSGTISGLYDYLSESIPEVPVLLLDEENFSEDLLQSLESKKTLIYRIAVYKDVNFHNLITRIFSSGATIINKYETEIRWNKKWFAIFHDPAYQYILTEEERNAISRFVPVTYVLTSTNLDEFLQQKDRYVFKLNRSYGGAGVFIGADNDTEFLRNAMSDLNEWTAQELINSDVLWLPEDETRVLKPHNIVLGLFHTIDQQSGFLVRANTSKRVVNMNTGTRIGWAFPCSIST